MGRKMTYDEIYRALMSEGIEEYVPDGISLSHPVVNLRQGRVVDSFLLFSKSRDGSKYTVPTARILIDSEKRELIEYMTTEEVAFSVYDGTDYYETEIENTDAEIIELEYQTTYLRMREIAFKPRCSNIEKEEIVRYIKALKTIELKHIQPFLFELGRDFFSWAKTVLSDK